MSGSTSNGNIINSGSVIGSGSDTIVLNVAEDQAAGTDAQFTVNVDGQQIGGLQTATASQSSGQQEQFTFEGNWNPGSHDVTVTFANNFLYPGTSGDRNLYVDGVTYDGQTVSNSATGIYQSPLFPPNSSQGNVSGNAVYTANDTTSVPAGAPSTPTTTPGAVSVGSGSDTLVLNMAEDAYAGDAQFTVSVDGQQVGGTQTTSALVAEGQQQQFDISGNWGSGTHSVAVTFTNDAVGGYYPGTALGLDTADRDLYVMGASLDGGPAASGLPWEQANAGTETFSVTAGSNPSTGVTSASAPSSSDPSSSSGSGSSTSNNATVTSTSVASDPSSSSSGSGSSTSNNATVTSTSLAPDPSSSTSSSGMSFVTAPSTAASTGSGSTGSNTSSTDTSTTGATVASGTSPSTQDWTAPSSTGSTDSSGTTSGAQGGQWWTNNQASNSSATGYYQQS